MSRTQMSAIFMSHDPVNHPKHYTQHPGGVECIQITEHMGFNLGNAIKYIWRADLKADAIEDLEKARWYIDRELQRRGKPRVTATCQNVGKIPARKFTDDDEV